MLQLHSCTVSQRGTGVAQGPLHISVAATVPIIICAGDLASLGSHTTDLASLGSHTRDLAPLGSHTTDLAPPGSHASWREHPPAGNSQPSRCLPSQAISSERMAVARGIYHLSGCRIPSADKVVYANRHQPVSPAYFSLLDSQLIIGYGGDQSPKSPDFALAPRSD